MPGRTIGRISGTGIRQSAMGGARAAGAGAAKARAKVGAGGRARAIGAKAPPPPRRRTKTSQVGTRPQVGPKGSKATAPPRRSTRPLRQAPSAEDISTARRTARAAATGIAAGAAGRVRSSGNRAVTNPNRDTAAAMRRGAAQAAGRRRK